MLVFGTILLRTSSSQKKGVVCVDPCNADTLRQLRAQWWYNYQVKPTFATNVQFIPMVFSVSRIDEIPGYSSHLLGFNQPDERGTSASEAAASWSNITQRSYTQTSPSTARNPSTAGSWLQQFMSMVPSANVSYIGLHRYNTSNPNSFIQAVTAVHDKFNKPIWITEFACQDNGQSTTNPFPQSQVNSFIDQVIPWLESTSWISHYAWHSASGGSSALWRADGSLTETGLRYASRGGSLNTTQNSQ